MTIKQLTEIVNGSLRPTDKQVDADLVEISQTEGNVLTTVEDGLLVDTSSLATKIELQEILTTLGVTPPSEWELTNATLVDGVLTYTGGTFEDEGGTGTITGLFAKKTLKVGESITIDFDLTEDASLLYFAVDNGVKVGSNSDIGALFAKDMNKVRLVAGRDWPDPFISYGEGWIYTATIQRVSTDRVILTLKDNSNTVRSVRNVYIQDADLKRVWILTSGKEVYSTNIVSTQSPVATTLSLDSKVDKEVGKTLTSNDYTDEDKTKLSNILPYEISGAVGSLTSVYREDLADRTVFTVNTVNVEGQMNTRNPSYINSPKVNSIPLYSLSNEGEYVLTEPDLWVSFNQSSYVFPVYHLSSVDDSYVKGLVNFSIQLMEGHLRVNYEHNVKSIIDDYSLQAQSSFLRLRNEYLPLTFTSSLNGELVYGIFDVPLSTLADGESVQSLLDGMLNVGTKPIFEFSLKSVGKETVKVNQTLNMGGSSQ